MSDEEIVEIVVTSASVDSLKRLRDEMIKHECWWIAARVRDEIQARERMPSKATEL